MSQVKGCSHPSDDKSISLLIKQKEARRVEEEMKAKQHEFSERMDGYVIRRNQLKKQKVKVCELLLFPVSTLCIITFVVLQLEQHIESFRHILQDSEIRKFRATQKINNESKEISQRTQEVNALSYQLDVAVARSILQLIDQLVESMWLIVATCCGLFCTENVKWLKRLKNTGKLKHSWRVYLL